MMNFDLTGTFKSSNHIKLNRSKSLFIRYLIFCYTRYNVILPVQTREAEDVQTVFRCLQTIKQSQNHTEPVQVNVADCGAAYRFLTALLAVTPGKWFLTGSPRILERPILPLVHSLQRAGANLQPEKDGILVTGTILRAPEMEIDCTLSSQFASALLLISPLTGLKTLHIIPEIPPSSSYIEMTRQVIADIDRAPGFSIPDIESDWSGAVFWYALAALKGEGSYYLHRLKLGSIQPDSIISAWFEKFGITSTQMPDGVIIENNYISRPTQPLQYDLRSNPDLAPVLGAFSVLYPCEIVLSGLQNLNMKESKRLDILAEELSKFAGIERPDNGSLHIMARERISGQQLTFRSYGDHRFVMAFMLFSVFNRVTLDETESVRKSYPGFPEDIYGLNPL